MEYRPKGYKIRPTCLSSFGLRQIMGRYTDKHIVTNYPADRLNRHALMAEMYPVRIYRNCYINAVVNE